MFETYMAMALLLSERGKYLTDPNPCVGCILVRDDEVVGRGYTQPVGGAHAEVQALREAGDRARGATAYVTLEPCSFHGRTPACTGALIDAGIARVVAAMADPHPNNSGKGFELLRAAGIDVITGVLEADAKRLMRGHVSKYQRGRPYVITKLAMGLDGRTALGNGDSNWITGTAARRDVQRLRAGVSAIVTGVATVIADNPRLNVRADELDLADAAAIAARRRPVYVLDSNHRMPADCALASRPDMVRVGTDAAAGLILPPDADGRVDLAALLDWLGTEGDCNEVLFECGPTLAGSLMDAGLIDELVVYMAPVIMGESARPLLRVAEIGNMGGLKRLTIRDVRQLGDDIRITLTPGT